MLWLEQGDMNWKAFFFIFIVFILCGNIKFLKAYFCDDDKADNLQAGNIGQSGHFPWLGVLRVHIHEGAEFKIALTGIVLIKERIAIANADDIARIPKKILLYDSKAMFIPSPGQTWTSKLKSFQTHPEHPFTTLNTIAIVELEVEEYGIVPVVPICWPHYLFNASDHLYAVGFRDDNQLLEKHIYKLTYLKPSTCEKFYNRSELSVNKIAPIHVQCGYSKIHNSSCMWDTGMIMASNATGRNWTLIGFGVQGPGCASPARFIDIFPYLTWIESATPVEEFNGFG